MLERTGGAVKRTSERTIGIDTESHSKETKNKKNAITTTAFPYKANNCLFVSFRKKRVTHPTEKKGGFHATDYFKVWRWKKTTVTKDNRHQSKKKAIHQNTNYNITCT